MSKKMMKRSLVLGALMAFVITGSAMAAELVVDSTSAYENLKSNNTWYHMWGSGNKYKEIYINSSNEGNNLVFGIENGTLLNVTEDIYGTYIIKKKENLIINKNTLNIKENTTTSNKLKNGYASVTGGNATVEDNTLNIFGTSKILGELTNVHINVSSGNGTEYTSRAINNITNISGYAETKNIYGVKVEDTGDNGNVVVKNNVVNIGDNVKIGATVDDFTKDFFEPGVYGAYVVNQCSYSEANPKSEAIVEGNSVVITGNATVTAKGIYGAYVVGTSGSKRSDEASFNFKVNNNTVIIEGGTINADIYGAYVEVENVKYTAPNGTTYGDGYTNVNDTIEANGNSTVLKNCTINGNVYAGYSAVRENHTQKDSSLQESVVKNEDVSNEPASNNTISLQGDVDVSNAKLYGNNGGEGTGNKLEVDESYSGDGKINTVGAFDEIVIDEMQYGETALTVTEKLEYKETDNSGNGGTKITVKRVNMSGNEDVSNGVNLNIITTGANATTDGKVGDGSSATIYKGTSEIIDVTFGNNDVNGTTGGIQVDENNITKKTRNDQVLVIGESRAAATAFVNQGSEIIETGLDALARDNSKAGDTKVFAAVYGNASEYATGSHVKVNGWSGIVGVGKTNANGLTVGAFFENGEGNYRTYNTVGNDFMRGDGEANYNGGGFLVRKDNPNGVYTEASLRAGNLQNELRKAVRDSEGLAGYDVDTFYYGAHVGVGKIIPRGNEGDSIDVYGKFIYTHHDSESFNIDGSDFHFDSVDSERLRLGFRINEVQTNKLSMYYGAAWEYEFGGDADNTTVGYDLSTPSLGGSTVIGEIGMHYLASEKWSLDLNVRGYSGERDGFTGSVQANYNF